MQFIDKVYRWKPQYWLIFTGHIITTSIQKGIVISRYGNRAEIEDENGQLISCHIRRALTDLVTGDRVTWEINEAEDSDFNGVITSREQRDSVLERPIRYQGLKAVAANIDHIYVVTAIEPPFSARILDRYLVAITQTGIESSLVLNKTDLISSGHEVYEQMKIYEDLGYNILQVSSFTPESLLTLNNSLSNKTSVFVGQSGVGKSSLVNALLPGTDTAVAELSDNSGLGTHTTTTSRLYRLPGGGILIDSPGIREFGMDHLEPSEIAMGFIEIAEFSESCKFRDCHHIKEPGCAVKAACNSGEIHPQRYENYLHLYEEAASAQADKPF